MTYFPDMDEDEDIAITNGGFDIDADWLKDPAWSIAAGVATLLSTAAVRSFLTQMLPDLIDEHVYKITFTILNANFQAGNGLIFRLGGTQDFTVFSTNGTREVQIESKDFALAIQISNNLFLIGDGCDIDNISITPLGNKFYVNKEIDHRKPRAAAIWDLPGGDKVHQALSYKDKTNCMIRYTP